MNRDDVVDSTLEYERQDVFLVKQVTRGTPLGSLVAADLVITEANQQSSMHRHNNAETVLFFLRGSGEVLLTEEYVPVAVTAGDRLNIGRGVFHAVRTGDEELEFLSVQSPPILDVEAGTRDLEPLDATQQ